MHYIFVFWGSMMNNKTYLDTLPFPLIEKINSYTKLGDKTKIYDVYFQDYKILRNRIVFIEIERCYFCFEQIPTFLYHSFSLCRGSFRCCLKCIFNIKKKEYKRHSYNNILETCCEKEKLSKYLLENSKVCLINIYYNSFSINLKLRKKLTDTKNMYIDFEKIYKQLKFYKNKSLCLGEFMKITKLTRNQILSNFKVEKIRPTKINYRRHFRSHYYLFDIDKILKYIKKIIDE